MDNPPFAPLTDFIDLLPDAVCMVDTKGRFVSISAACERIFGYTQEEMTGRAMIEMVLPEDRARTLQAAKEIMSGQLRPHFENRYLRKDGRVVHIMWSACWAETDQLRIAVARDITERKQAESMKAALYAISEAAHTTDDLSELFQQIHRIIGGLLPALNFTVALYDEVSGELSFPYRTNEHEQASEFGKTASGMLISEVIRTGEALLLTPEEQPDFATGLGLELGHGWLSVPLKSLNGIIGALAMKSCVDGVCYTVKDKELLQFVSIQVAAAIERKQLNERLYFMAQYDQLTNLPNRRLLYDRLEVALTRVRREQGRLSLLYLDLDNFKQVNDTLGHAAGDQLLQEVAQRLKQIVRKVDTVARFGGDEFVVLLEQIKLPEHALVVAEKIRNQLSQPFELAEHSLCALPSIGIALYPEHGEKAEQLIKHADTAMYSAKKNGGNRFLT